MNLFLFLQLRDHFVDKGMGRQDDVGVKFLHRGEQLTGDDIVYQRHKPGERCFAIGRLVQLSENLGLFGGEKVVPITDGLIKNGIDAFKRIYHPGL